MSALDSVTLDERYVSSSNSSLLFFHSDTPVSLSLQDYKRIWPYVSNIWTTAGKGYTSKKTSIEKKRYNCRCNNQHAKDVNQENRDSTKKRRISKTSIEGACSATLLVQINHPARIVELAFNETHSHSLQESDIKKTSDAVRDVLKVKKKSGQTNCGVDYVKYQNASNLYSSEQGISTSGDLEKDIEDVLEYLNSENDSRNPSFSKLLVFPENLEEKMLFFTTQWQIESLQKYGQLVLIDTTHNINSSKWKLTTVYFQNHVGVWLPGAQMLLSVENSNLISAGLKLLKDYCKTDMNSWNPFYFIIDDRSTVAQGILEAFTGLSAGEQMVRIYYCKVNLTRILMRNLSKEKECYHLMLKAMNETTKIGCENVLEEALEVCLNTSTKEYLIKNWKNDTAKWGIYARQHSPLLLQNLTTNAIKSYHNQIKRECKITDSFRGTITNLQYILQRKISETQSREFKYKNSRFKACEDYAILKKFTLPFQELLIKEMEKAHEIYVDNSEKPDWILENNECQCEFFRKYLLPCRHFFYLDIYRHENVLTDEYWSKCIADFGGCTLDVYKSREFAVTQTGEEQ